MAAEDEGTCPGCGAVLPPPDSSGIVRCDSCGRVLHEDEKPAPPAPQVINVNIPMGGGTLPSPIGFNMPMSSASGSWAGRIVLFSILISVIFGIAVVAITTSATVHHLPSFSSGGGGGSITTSNVTLSGGDEVLLPGEPQQPLDVVGLFYDSTADGRYVGRARLGTAGLVWHGPLLPKDVSSAELALDGQRLYVAAQDQVSAYDLQKGTVAWSAKLSDTVESRCASCLMVLGGRVIVRSHDDVVHSLNPTTGARLWDRRLVATNGQVLTAGGMLVLTDRVAQVGQLDVVDPATGRNQRVVTPACPVDPVSGGYVNRFEPYNTTQPIAGTSDVVIVISGGFPCIERWNLLTGQQVWSAAEPGDGSVDDSHVLVAGGQLIAPSSRRLDAVDLATGHDRTLALGADESATALAVVGQRLLGIVSQTRGSARPALAAWDLATAARLWTRSVQGADPFSLPSQRTTDELYSTSSKFLVDTDSVPLRIVRMDRDAHRLTVESVDAVSGRSVKTVVGAYRPRYDSGSNSVGIVRVHGDQLVVTIDSVLEVVDLRQAAVTGTWPPS